MQVGASSLLHFAFTYGMQVCLIQVFVLSTLFNIQLVAAVPGGCSSLHQENVENQHGLTCSQWQWIVHIEASSLLHFAFTWHASICLIQVFVSVNSFQHPAPSSCPWWL